MEPKLSFPKEMRMITTSIHNAVNPQDMNYCTATNEHRIQHHERTIKQHLDRAHKVSTQHSPRRSYTIQPTKEQCNTAHEGAIQRSPRRSNSTQPTQEHHEDGLHTRLPQNKNQPARTTRVRQCRAQSPQARGRLNRNWRQVNLYSPMHGEEAATLTLKLLPISGSVSNVS